MPRTSLVLIGASAGGIQALNRLLPAFPSQFPAAIAIVVHRFIDDENDSLPRILQRHCKLPVGSPVNGESIRQGHVYVGPGGLHLEVFDDQFHLSKGPRENASRPAIDVLFRTAAQARGRKLVGVLLSGVLTDGTAGLAAIKAAGGYAIVQEPSEARFGDMPRNAMARVDVDEVLPVQEMANRILSALERITIPLGTRRSPDVDEPSEFSCPDCGGVLWKIEQDGVLRYRCRIGHAYSTESLSSRQDVKLEEALWSAVRALEERANMSELLAERLRGSRLRSAAERLEREARMLRERAEVVRASAAEIIADRAATGTNGLSELTEEE
jgi:two-component system, chemotaxis family, protein-glutamate methylesterase/glutaminase